MLPAALAFQFPLRNTPRRSGTFRVPQLFRRPPLALRAFICSTEPATWGFRAHGGYVGVVSVKTARKVLKRPKTSEKVEARGEVVLSVGPYQLKWERNILILINYPSVVTRVSHVFHTCIGA